MMNTEVSNPVIPMTDEQQNSHHVHAQKKPDWMDRFMAWTESKVNHIGSFIWDNKEFLAQVLLSDMDSRRTQKNVRRVIEQRQEIEIQTPSLYLKTTIPQYQHPAATMERAGHPPIKQQRQPQVHDGESQKER